MFNQITIEIVKESFNFISIIAIFLLPATAYSSFAIDAEPANRKEQAKDVDLVATEKTGDELLFQAYKENYMLFASTRGDSKFQISFKYKFFTNSSKDKNIFSVPLYGQKIFWEKLYFGYTQKSVWDWNKDSAPFEDHNFNPEVFWCSDYNSCDKLERNNEAWNSRYYIGVEHESNGQDSVSSRSWDRLYFRWIYWKDSYAIAPKAWYILSKSVNNSDISDYVGYFDLEFFVKKPDGFAYGLTLRSGSEGGSVVADISVPNKVMMKKLFGVNSNFNPHWYIQLFSGYGEDLLMYNRKRDVLRFGIKFTL